MAILVTGGAGYIGSHCVQRLLRDGHIVVALDNLFRGHREAVMLLERTPGAKDRLTFVKGDIADRPLLDQVLAKHGITTVIHFAAMAYVGESVQQPLAYYRNNTAGSLTLLEACDAANVARFVFSSTCATYGEPGKGEVPIRESLHQSPINPYGWSKLFTERMLKDFAALRRTQGKPFGYAALRYFNVAGCDRSGILGEDHEPETHLIPVALQTALGKRDSMTVFGTDYPTPDGTCIRDYVHVEDLVDAHVSVMSALQPGDERFYNLGVGTGISVRQIIDSVQRVTGRTLNVKEGLRRPGDPPELFADPSKIRTELGWSARITDLDEIVASAWKWFSAHPGGYRDLR